MLQNLRDNSQGIIAKAIVGFIIITFALWGIDSLVGLATGSGAPVKVNGVDISEQQILQGMELQRRQMLAQMGDNADPSLIDETRLRQGVIDRLIDETVLIESAGDQGLAVGKDFLDQIILSTKAFQVDGRFDRDQFNAMLRNAGLTAVGYRDLLRRETLINQEQSAVVNSAFVTTQELDRLRALDRQTRSVRYLLLPVAAEMAQVAVDDAEVERYFAEQKARFTTAEQVGIDYISLDLQGLTQQVEVSDEDVRTAYDQMLGAFESQEARQAAHILIAVDDSRDDATAEALANTVKARLDAGEDFAALAKEFSDDTGSAVAGGDLGLVEKDVMVPEFEQALFTLAVDEVSAPVRTDFGYHLIRLVNIEHSTVPSYEEARAGLLDELRQREAESRFVGKVEELADVSFSAADLKEPAEVLGLEIQTLAPFGREGGDSQVGSHPRVIEAAFSDDLLLQGHNSAVIELSPQQAVVIRVREHLPSRPQELAEVREQIVAELKQRKAAALVLERATAVAAAVRQGESGDGEWTTQATVQRGDQTLPPELLQALFRMPKPVGDAVSVKTVALRDGGAAVLVLDGVSDGTLESMDESEAQMLKAFLASRMGQYDYRSAVVNRRQAAEVERL